MIARIRSSLAVTVGALALLGGIAPLRAQLPAVSQPVVQAVPGREGMNLNAALARLGNDPRDVGALIDAGNAALAMGDVDASIGFYSRADQVAPDNPRVKAGLAGALVRSENPYDAIPLFEQAERAGVMDAALSADRGLAYDMVGDNETAQRYYRQALMRGSSDEVIRRLALSQAIAGDRRSAELTLAPLLQKQDKAALRTRAFVFAIAGQVEEAVAIAGTALPGDLAAGISPYLRYMPRLTPAQQAAAANFGHFPRASEIGRDDPRVALYAPVRRPVVAAAPPAAGRPAARTSRNRRAPAPAPAAAPARSSQTALAAATPQRIAPPDIMPTREVTGQPQLQAARPVAVAAAPAPSAEPLPPPPVAAPVRVTAQVSPLDLPPPPAARVVASASAAAPTPSVPTPSVALPAPSTGPGFAILDRSAPPPPESSAELPPIAAPAPAAVPAPQPAPAPAPPVPSPPAPRPSIADAFSDLARPTIDIAPAAGAVDIRSIRPARAPAPAVAARDAAGKPVAAKPVKPPPPSHPSRIWVQVATGRDKAALGFDWRRMSRQSPEVFRGRQPFTSAWGQTNRLLTGPFPTEAAANAFIVQLRRADVDGAFVFNSPAGQVVDTLATR